MKILWIFLGSSQNWTVLWGLFYIYFYILGSFLKVNVQNGNIFLGAKMKKKNGYA